MIQIVKELSKKTGGMHMEMKADDGHIRILAELEKNYKILLNGDKGALINAGLSLNSIIGIRVNIHNIIL